MSNRNLGSCIEIIYNRRQQADDVARQQVDDDARVYTPIIARYLFRVFTIKLFFLTRARSCFCIPF